METQQHQGPYTGLLLEGANELTNAGENAVRNLQGHLTHHLENCQRLGDKPDQAYVTSVQEALTLLQ